jgi:transcriptional regulator
MYTPNHFKSDDTDEAFELMRDYPFATVISIDNSQPVISHLPLTPVKSKNGIQLIGHLAKANPHCQVLTKQEKITAIFHGPHTYISPEWYTAPGVPTWNYLSVHVTGTVKVSENYDETLEALKILVNHAEKKWPSGWKFSLPDPLSDPEVLMKSISAFTITVESIQFKKKLNQNYSQENIQGVIKGLSERSDENSRLIKEGMEKL